jgi:hypothetical protein
MVKIVNGTIVSDDTPQAQVGQSSSSQDIAAMATEQVDIFGVKAPKWSLVAGVLFAFFVGGLPGMLIAGAIVGAGYYAGRQAANPSQSSGSSSGGRGGGGSSGRPRGANVRSISDYPKAAPKS